MSKGEFGEPRECKCRSCSCTRAMDGIPDPAAFTEAVRGLMTTAEAVRQMIDTNSSLAYAKNMGLESALATLRGVMEGEQS